MASSMRYILSLTIVLAGLWLAVSGVYKPLLFILGGGSVALVVWLSLRMDVVGVEHDPALYSWRLPIYWAWLFWQIVLTNINVAGRILRPHSIRSHLLTVPVPMSTAVGKVTYANSCTLTPGTVALHLTEDILTVHALDAYSSQDLKAGHMARKIGWLEGQPSGSEPTR
jgi:multicomponent Na+:H+ antiporter subunit E